jgi:hypothetical protein
MQLRVFKLLVAPLEGESALLEQKPSQTFIVDQDVDMLKSTSERPADRTRAKKKSKVTNESENEEDIHITKSIDEDTKIKKFKNPPKMDLPEIVQ